MPVATALQKAVMVSEEDIATACRTAMVDAMGTQEVPASRRRRKRESAT